MSKEKEIKKISDLAANEKLSGKTRASIQRKAKSLKHKTVLK